MTVTGATSGAEAVVVGAGPNGLAAAIELARSGRSVHVLEANEAIGGGCRSEALTLPGFVHDTCAAIHPLGVASPFFRSVPLETYGLSWIQPPLALAHPFHDGTAATLARSIEDTAATLGEDGRAWSSTFAPLVRDVDLLIDALLGPLRIPRHPIALARFGLPALLPADRFARLRFHGTRARGFFAGMAAHSMLDLSEPVSAAFGLVLGVIGHAVGWPVPEGGSQRITDALAAHLQSLGGTIQTGARVTSLEDVTGANAVLFDLTPRQFLDIAGDRVPDRFRRILSHYRYGPGVFKIDWALDGPVPWTAAECRLAGTVHLGPTLEDIAAAEHDVTVGKHPQRPFVLLAQQSLFDPSRSPAGKHVLWGYCHVPNGSTVDMTDRIEAQIERFAPGFSELVIARSTRTAVDMQAHDANFIGGDINAGLQNWRQLFTRPAPRFDPYSTPDPRLYFCSASTPPGGGVHGMAGYHAAHSALKRAW